MTELHHSRYTLKKRLGGGDMSLTYLAWDQQDNKEVVIKALESGYLKDWKLVELFEREVNTLEQLSHAGIPKILDHWEDTESGGLYLVSEKIQGKTLEEKIEEGWHPTESEVQDIVVQLLQILDYLHAFRPPYIHRDIKPSNVMLTPAKKVYLIDFGAVQGVIKPQGHSTVVGTFGYMAPEQYHGKPTPASDLYSTGVSAIYLLSRRPIEHMVDENLNLNFRPHVQSSAVFANWLEKMVAPALNKRFESAKEALKALHPESQAIVVDKRDEKECMVRRKSGQMWILMKPTGTVKAWAAVAFLAGFFEFWVVHSFFQVALHNARTWMGGSAMFLFVLPFYLMCFLLMGGGLYTFGLKKTLTLTKDTYQLKSAIFGLIHWWKDGKLSDIMDCSLPRPQHTQGNPLRDQLGTLKLQLGYHKQLSLGWGNAWADKAWVHREIEEFRQRHQG